MSSEKSDSKETERGLIPKDWQYKKLGDLTLVITKGTTPTTLKKKFTDSGINFIKVESITDSGDFVDTKFSYIDEETNLILSRSILTENDILFSIAGSIGRTAIVKRRILPANTNQALAIIRPNSDLVFPIYLRHYLSNKKYVNDIRGNVVQSVQANLSLSELSNSIINLPPLPEQKAIAKVLSDLDDKIELNNEMNKTLEEIGQSLFKRWFIDFEFPDANGNPYRSSGGDMVFSEELGKEIPKGWEVDKLGNHVNLVKGVSYRSEELTESENALVTLKSIDRKGNFKIDGLKEYVGKYKDEQILFSGDIVVAHTDLTQKADVLGNPAIVREVSKYEKLIASLDLVIVRPKNEYINRPFIYHLLKTNAFHNHAIGYANGTTVLHLNHKAIPDFEFVVPSFTIIKNFGENINQITLKLQDNELQSECLAQIRDFILPKLMSGEIRVPLEAIQ